MPVGHGEQALGLGIVLWARHRSSRWRNVRVPVGDSRSCPGRCVPAAMRCGLMLLAAGVLPGCW
jgi:hypothetical protein